MERQQQNIMIIFTNSKQKCSLILTDVTLKKQTLFYQSAILFTNIEAIYLTLKLSIKYERKNYFKVPKNIIKITTDSKCRDDTIHKYYSSFDDWADSNTTIECKILRSYYNIPNIKLQQKQTTHNKFSTNNTIETLKAFGELNGLKKHERKLLGI